jgi:hypothetical protein
MPWTFLDYVDSGGSNQIEAWLDSLPPGTRQAVESKLTARLLYGREQRELRPPYFKKMRAVNLIEVRFQQGKVVFRILGCYGPGSAVTLLIGATKTGKQMAPPNAIRTAQRRRDEILSGRRRVAKQCLLERIS